MTRVNVVDPCHLTNSHLMAEYREIPRIITAVEKAIKADKTPEDFKIPDTYLFGTGHVTFFYDKLGYIADRIRQLREELEDRKYTLDDVIYFSYLRRYKALPDCWKKDWTPTPEDIYLNMARLVERHYKTAMRVEGKEVLEPCQTVDVTLLDS